MCINGASEGIYWDFKKSLCLQSQVTFAPRLRTTRWGGLEEKGRKKKCKTWSELCSGLPLVWSLSFPIAGRGCTYVSFPLFATAEVTRLRLAERDNSDEHGIVADSFECCLTGPEHLVPNPVADCSAFCFRRIAPVLSTIYSRAVKLKYTINKYKMSNKVNGQHWYLLKKIPSRCSSEAFYMNPNTFCFNKQHLILYNK